MDIEFVSYSGKYPCRCMGQLVVKINGREVSFGDGESKGDYPEFWASGGEATFADQIDWEPIVTQGDWYLSADERSYPKKIWKLLPKLIDLMNDHVYPGCCGGCL